MVGFKVNKYFIAGLCSLILGSFFLVAISKTFLEMLPLIEKGKIIYQDETRIDVINSITPTPLILIKFGVIAIAAFSLVIIGFYLIKRQKKTT